MARVGTSGWSYPHWRGVLYERGVPQGRWLERYAEEFDVVELDGSFYHWPSEDRLRAWAARVPDGFAIAVKAPRGLTHARRLREPGEWIRRIQAGMAALGDRCGPLLVQLPPEMSRDDARLDGFLAALPAGIRAVVELRHPSWVDEAVFRLLERRGATYCVMSGAGLPCVLRATAPLVYVRLHGPDPHVLYAGSYSDADLSWWADRVGEWERAGHEVWVLFDNDGEGNAVRNARTLLRLLG